jgi:hypothetical protein
MCIFHTPSSFVLLDAPHCGLLRFFLGGRGWCSYANLCSFVHYLRSFSCVVVVISLLFSVLFLVCGVISLATLSSCVFVSWDRQRHN